MLAVTGMLVNVHPIPAAARVPAVKPPAFFLCIVESVQDGDTLRCVGDVRRVRLAAIDAPDMPRVCRKGRRCGAGAPLKARDRLRLLTHAQVLRCEETGRGLFDGVRAWCWRSDGIQLNCAMVRSGLALLQPKLDPSRRLCTGFQIKRLYTAG